MARQLVADQDGLGYYVWIFLGLESQGQKSDVHSMVAYKAWEWALGPVSTGPDQVGDVGSTCRQRPW